MRKLREDLFYVFPAFLLAPLVFFPVFLVVFAPVFFFLEFFAQKRPSYDE